MKKIKNKPLFIFRIISILIISICLILFLLWQKDNNSNKKIQNTLKGYIEFKEFDNLPETVDNSNTSVDNSGSLDISITSKLLADFDGLNSINSDTIGWIKLNNSNIDYPVVQTNNNNYYLTHNFYKESNGAGWIFADYRNSFPQLSKNTVIYGHNRRNGTMFSNLNNLIKSSSLFNSEKNTYFYFSTEKQSYLAKIFSVYKLNEYDVSINTNFENDDEFIKYVDQITHQSIYNFQEVLSPSDHIITLCTCDNTNNYRILVHAKLILYN